MRFGGRCHLTWFLCVPMLWFLFCANALLVSCLLCVCWGGVGLEAFFLKMAVAVQPFEQPP